MIFFSLFFLTITGAWAVEVQLESKWYDNPDQTFIPATRSTFVLGPTIEHKFKTKKDGTFILVRSKLEYKHDTEANRLRDGEASSSLLIIKPLKSILVGASLSAGHLWRWRRDYNVNSNRFQELDGDHFFLETRLFGEKKIANNWVSETSLIWRVEDYASTYSIYVNQENDNINTTINTSLAYKEPGFEIKPVISFARKFWRERRALSRDGFFVSPGEELKPDRIDTFITTLKGSVNYGKFSFGLSPNWSRVNDLNNEGRSWTGPGVSSEINFPTSSYSSKLKVDWSKRDYETQLSSFQMAGTGRLEDETFSFMAATNGKLGEWQVEGAHGLERTKSNQTDGQNRKIGMIKSSRTSLSIKRDF